MYLNKETNKIVKEGDNINLKNVSKETLKALSNTGVLKESKDADDTFALLTAGFAESTDMWRRYYPKIPNLVVSDIIMRMAKFIELKYQGHIKDVPEVLYINLADGSIYGRPSDKINFKIQPAFRYEKDAKWVLEVITPLLNDK